jgi:hypothetical protein
VALGRATVCAYYQTVTLLCCTEIASQTRHGGSADGARLTKTHFSLWWTQPDTLNRCRAASRTRGLRRRRTQPQLSRTACAWRARA